MPQQSQASSGPIYSYADVPELSETFADSLHTFLFDGQTLRITFAVNRIDAPQPPQPTTGKRYPVCRLVLTAACAAELSNQLNKLAAAVTQAQPSLAAGSASAKAN